MTADAAVKWTALPEEATFSSASDNLNGSLNKAGSVLLIAVVNRKARIIRVNDPAVPFDQKALAPRFVAGETIFMEEVSVELTRDEQDGVIYYTLDGSEPDERSNHYKEPIVLKAITVVVHKENSSILSSVWTKVVPPGGGDFGGEGFVSPVITATVGQNAVDIEAGKPITAARNSKLALSAPVGQFIYYTTDGTKPTKNSLQYKGEILITGNMLIKSITDKNDQVVTITYNVANAIYELKSTANQTPYITGYENHKFKPNKALSRYELIEAISRLIDKENVNVGHLFSDVGSSEEELVSFFTSAGIVEGYPNGTFRSKRGLTRAEFVVIMSRVLKLSIESKGVATLSDVKGHWSENYINAFTAAGYVQGFPNGTFRPNDEISRAQAVVLINRIIGMRKQGEGSVAYNDLKPSHWAYEEIMSAVIN